MNTPTQMSFLTTPSLRVTIRELPTTEQPQERLSRYGPAALSSAELLAIVLGLTDLGQAETLLARYEGLDGLVKAPLAELAGRYRGIGRGKAHQLKAAFELGRRSIVALPPSACASSRPPTRPACCWPIWARWSKRSCARSSWTARTRCSRSTRCTKAPSTRRCCASRRCSARPSASTRPALIVVTQPSHLAIRVSVARGRSRHPPARRSRQAAQHRRARPPRDRQPDIFSRSRSAA